MSKELGNNSLIKSTIVSNDRLVIVDSEDIGINSNPKVKTVSYSLFKTFYNVTSYGVIGDNSTINTTILQNLINTITSSGGGVLYFPSGVYKTGKITINKTIFIKGDGKVNSIIKGITADVLIEYDYSGSHPNSSIQDIQLDGNNIATIGLNLLEIALYDFTNLLIKNFTSHGIKGLGALEATLRLSQIYNCPIGIEQDWSTNHNQPNLFLIEGCQFQGCSSWAIKWSHFASLTLRNCEINSGTINDYNTGCVYVTNLSPLNEGVGLIMDSCWLEGMLGNGVKVDGAIYPTLNVIRNCIFLHNPANGTVRSINIDGSNINTVLLLDHCKIDDTVYANGLHAEIRNNGSIVTNAPSLNNSSVLKSLTYL